MVFFGQYGFNAAFVFMQTAKAVVNGRPAYPAPSKRAFPPLAARRRARVFASVMLFPLFDHCGFSELYWNSITFEFCAPFP